MRSIYFLIATFCCSYLVSCQGGSSMPTQNAETRQMVAELKALVDNGNPVGYYHWNSKLALMLKQKLASASNDQKEQIWFQYCMQLLFAGDNATCITEVEQKIGEISAANLNNQNQALFELLALAYLRLGERENCQLAHSAYSCILPLDKSAWHQQKKGSQKALAIFTLLNNKFPSERYVWLQNLAAMTLGEYPNSVPKNAKITFPNWQLEQQEFPPFEEIAMNVGVAQNGLSGGTCLDDFNRDGLLDIFTTSYGMSDQVKLFINNGKGSFDDKTIEAGLLGITSGLNCIHADYDNDGDKDILILRGAWLGPSGAHPNSLLRNNGHGFFDDVTRSSGLLSYHPTQTASWADFNKDGYLDLFIGNEGNSPGHPCELYLNKGNGTFEEVANQYGLGNINLFVKGVIWGDINNDTWPDLYISVQGGENLLFKNNKGQFENITKSAGVSQPIFSFPCWFWDVNNDGFEDLFVSGYDGKFLHEIGGDYARELRGMNFTSERPRLFINNGNETFTELSKKYHVNKTMYTMGSNFGDLDNDGYLDFYVGTGSPDFTSVVPNRMFRNVEGNYFEEVTSAGRFGHIQKGHGIAFADLDNDGDQDIYAVMGGAFEGDVFTNVLFNNPISINNWITLELNGTKTNRDGVGTKLELLLDNGQRIYRVVNTGGTFGSSSIQQEIGIGKAKALKELKVNWQNGKSQVFYNLPIKKKLKITEGKDQYETYSLNPIPWSKPGHMHHHEGSF